MEKYTASTEDQKQNLGTHIWGEGVGTASRGKNSKTLRIQMVQEKQQLVSLFTHFHFKNLVADVIIKEGLLVIQLPRCAPLSPIYWCMLIYKLRLDVLIAPLTVIGVSSQLRSFNHFNRRSETEFGNTHWRTDFFLLLQVVKTSRCWEYIWFGRSNS